MSFARNTPIQFLPGIGQRTAQVMHRLGIHTAGQLNTVPEEMLIELFGPSIKRILQFVSVRSVRSEASYKAAPTASTPSYNHLYAAPTAPRSASFLKRMRTAMKLAAFL